MRYPEDFENKLLQGDCLEVMNEIPDKSIDHVITSPPYNMGKSIYHKKDVYSGFKDDNELYREWTIKVIKSLLRVTKRHIFYNIQMLTNNKLAVFDIFSEFKNNVKEVIIWNKRSAAPAVQQGVMTSKFEFIIILSNENPENRKFNETVFHGNVNNVLEGRTAIGNKYSHLHSATFPIYLPQTLIRNFTQEEEIILDPFMGLGTTAMACKYENRKYIGIELNTQFIDISRERLRQGSLDI